MGWLPQDYMGTLLLEAALDERRYVGLGFFVFRREGPPPGPVQGGEALCCVCLIGLLHDSAF